MKECTRCSGIGHAGIGRRVVAYVHGVAVGVKYVFGHLGAKIIAPCENTCAIGLDEVVLHLARQGVVVEQHDSIRIAVYFVAFIHFKIGAEQVHANDSVHATWMSDDISLNVNISRRHLNAHIAIIKGVTLNQNVRYQALVSAKYAYAGVATGEMVVKYSQIVGFCGSNAKLKTTEHTATKYRPSYVKKVIFFEPNAGFGFAYGGNVGKGK